MSTTTPRGNQETAATVVVTGVSGFLGQRLLPLLDASPAVARVVGLDVQDPARRARKLTFHRADVVNADLDALLRGADLVVHLAAIVGPILDEALMTRVNCDGTQRVLDAAARTGIRRVVRPSSAAVYGAWPNNPVPLTEDAPLRPNPGFLPALLDAECERRLTDWERAGEARVATRLRIAPIVGPGASSLFAAIATGRPPVVLRHAAAPVQVVHVDDAASALLLAVERELRGAYNVSADGWLGADEAAALHPRRHLPGLPADAAERVLQVTWTSGFGDAPPSVLPYLLHPWVVANDRIEALGWKPVHTNEEAILLASPAERPTVLPLVAAGAALAGAAGAAWWLARSRGRRGRSLV